MRDAERTVPTPRRGNRGPGTTATRRVAGIAARTFLALAVAGCGTPEERYRVLSLFFDGVPDPSKAAMAEAEGAGTTAGDPQATQAPTSGPTTVMHLPFRQRDCDGCHGGKGPTKSALGASALCFRCHAKDRILPARAHDPVAEGQCRACHLPHESDFPYLFPRAPEQVCGECHDPDDGAFKAFHDDLGADRRCTDCHAGHGGPEPFFLRADPGAPACARCHFDDLAAREPLHGPVALGQCLQCHELHKSRRPGHLRARVDELCLGCHAAADLRSRAAHASGPLADCTRCHDAHGSGRPLLLKAGIPGPPPMAPVESPVPPPSPGEAP